MGVSCNRRPTRLWIRRRAARRAAARFRRSRPGWSRGTPACRRRARTRAAGSTAWPRRGRAPSCRAGRGARRVRVAAAMPDRVRLRSREGGHAGADFAHSRGSRAGPPPRRTVPRSGRRARPQAGRPRDRSFFGVAGQCVRSHKMRATRVIRQRHAPPSDRRLRRDPHPDPGGAISARVGPADPSRRVPPCAGAPSHGRLWQRPTAVCSHVGRRRQGRARASAPKHPRTKTRDSRTTPAPDSA
jgi:hypothetical protein